MAVFRRVGGSADRYQEHPVTIPYWYDVTADGAGVAVPQAGDTVNITAAASPGVYRQGAFYTFPIGVTVTRILYEPEVPEPILINIPNAAIGYTIHGQVMNLDGIKGVLDM